MKKLLPLLLAAGCAERRPEDIPTAGIDASLAEVKTMKAFVHASIHGFEKDGGFDAQVVWRAPSDLRVRCTYFEFACGNGKFQLYTPEDRKFVRGSIADFRKSSRGALIQLFEAVLPRRPAFFAYASHDAYFYAVAEDSVVRFRGTTPVDRHWVGVHAKYEEVTEGVPLQVTARMGQKVLNVSLDRAKLKTNVPVRDDLFEMAPPEGVTIEDFRP